MKHAPIVALALAAAFVAGCGGGSSVTDEEHAALQQELEAAREAERLAEEARRRAEQEAANERNRADQAEGQLDNEQTARQEAEERAEDLEKEAGHTAIQLVQANARQVFNGLDDSIENSAGDSDAEAPTVTPRYGQSALVNTGDPAVTFSSITTSTSNKWRKTSFSNRAFDFTDRLDVYSDAEAATSSPFNSVYHEAVGGNAATAVVVDRYNPDADAATTVIDDNKVVGSVQISTTAEPADRSDAASSLFPRSGAPRKDFDQSDRGEYTLAQRQTVLDEYNPALAAARAANQALTPGNRRTDAQVIATVRAALTTENATDILDHTGLFRNQDRYPLRYTAEVGGSLGGASGTYTCASSDTTGEADCRVTNQNNHFRFVGPWVFTPSSASATVRVDDSEFMYFGWWARQSNSTGVWTFQTFHGPTETGADGNRSTAAEISRLSGTATYKGTAVGQFSFYQPNTAQSDYGGFTAAAELTADFGANTSHTDGTVYGTIDDFTATRTGQSYSDWSLTLKSGAISNVSATAANSTNGVSWSIEGEAIAAPDAGFWEAAFYSNLPADQRTTATPNEDAVPTGIAGTFEAAYHHVGRMIGAFGAHKEP